MRQKEWCLEGSFTIEMTFIMPIILYVILLVCYLNFYLYDKNRIAFVISYEVEQYIQKERRHLSSTNLSILQQKLVEECSHALFLFKPKNILVEAEGEFLRVHLTLKSSIIRSNVSQSFHMLHYNPYSYIRTDTIENANSS